MKAPKELNENWAMQVNMGTIKSIVAIWVVAVGLILGGATLYVANNEDLRASLSFPAMQSDGPSIFDPASETQSEELHKFQGQEASGPDSVERQGQVQEFR